jgi:hypothetical protein
MSSDSSDKERPAPRANLWALPDVLEVRAARVRFKKPLIRYEGRKRVEHAAAVELMVRTSGPIPERAISPVLVVGDAEITDYEYAGHNFYRFHAFDMEKLREGAPVTLAWPQEKRRTERETPTFRLRGEETR